ncbi:MAG: flagellar P-ring protein precursor FlgI [Candidatus Midichloriaceae bacterium]|jgi:flagellar P-ring protein precursor FlgI
MLLFLVINTEHTIADSRIKDIVNFEGIRDNVLIGYGLVTGLDGTGDNLQNSSFTQKGLVNLLEKLGINTRGENIKTKNVAAVMVTATLPGFSKSGNRFSINLSTLGDAKSLKGGTLVATPLMGIDGKIYAVAQGQIGIGKLSDSTQANFKPILTSGYIINGATVEKKINFDLNSLSNINISLKNPDLTTARFIANSINSYLGSSSAKAQDPGTVSLQVPKEYNDNVVGLLSDIENIQIVPDTTAKIIIDEATGTVVIGNNVKISKVAVAQRNLVVKVAPFEEFDLQSTSNLPTNRKTEEYPPGTALKTIEPTANLSDLVHGLNSLGVKTQDLIIILKSIHQAGALQATIEVK